jgi:hypothetical protein
MYRPEQGHGASTGLSARFRDASPKSSIAKRKPEQAKATRVRLRNIAGPPKPAFALRENPAPHASSIGAFPCPALSLSGAFPVRRLYPPFPHVSRGNAGSDALGRDGEIWNAARVSRRNQVQADCVPRSAIESAQIARACLLIPLYKAEIDHVSWLWIGSIHDRRNLERDEEKWTPVFRPHPALHLWNRSRLMIDSIHDRRDLERDEEKWTPVFRPHPALHLWNRSRLMIDSIHDRRDLERIARKSVSGFAKWRSSTYMIFERPFSLSGDSTRKRDAPGV